MKANASTPWLVLFDTLFVMLLCFATLLSAVLFKGESGPGIRYFLNLPTVALTVGALALYFGYLLPRSERGLHQTVSQVYGNAHDNEA